MAFFLAIKIGNLADIFFLVFWGNGIDSGCRSTIASNMTFLAKLLVVSFLLVKKTTVSITTL